MASQPTNPDAKPTDERELIRDLAALIETTGLTEIEVEREGLRVRVVRAAAPVAPAPVVVTAAAAHPTGPPLGGGRPPPLFPQTPPALAPRRGSAPPISRPSRAQSRSSMSAARSAPARRY